MPHTSGAGAPGVATGHQGARDVRVSSDWEITRMRNFLIHRMRWIDANIQRIGSFEKGTLHY